jgi:uncharacterized membrane protein YdbT with pleckstrin-like domain
MRTDINLHADSMKSGYRQSFRGFIRHYLEIAAGGVLLVAPFKVINWLFHLINIVEIPEWINAKELETGCTIFGIVLIAHGLRFIYSYFAIKMIFDDDGVIMKKGIIAQSQVQIRFNDIKTMGMQQSIVERLLGIGTVHLDSAGTNSTVDIEFKNIRNPVYICRHIQQLIDLHMKQR